MRLSTAELECIFFNQIQGSRRVSVHGPVPAFFFFSNKIHRLKKSSTYVLCTAEILEFYSIHDSTGLRTHLPCKQKNKQRQINIHTHTNTSHKQTETQADQWTASLTVSSASGIKRINFESCGIFRILTKINWYKKCFFRLHQMTDSYLLHLDVKFSPLWVSSQLCVPCFRCCSGFKGFETTDLNLSPSHHNVLIFGTKLPDSTKLWVNVFQTWTASQTQSSWDVVWLCETKHDHYGRNSLWYQTAEV